MTENEDPLVTYTREKWKGVRSVSDSDLSPSEEAGEAEEVAPGAVCPVCGRPDCFWATHAMDSIPDCEGCIYPAPAEPRDSSEGQHPAQMTVGADRPGHASPADPGAGSTGNSDRSAPESPASEVVAKLAYWLQHARNAGAPHVCIPCEAAEEILKLLGDK
jgi:hypothetical protein